MLNFDLNYTCFERENEEDMAQTYDKNPYTNRKNQWTTQTCYQILRLPNDCGPT